MLAVTLWGLAAAACVLPTAVDPNSACVEDANGFATLDADSDPDVPISLVISTKSETVDAFSVVHPATVGSLSDDTATDGRYILSCPQEAGKKSVQLSISRPADLTAFGAEWVQLFPKDSWSNSSNEFEPFSFNDFGAKIPLTEFRPTSTDLADDAPTTDVLHVFMELSGEGDFELKYGNPNLVSGGKWVAVEFKSTLLRVGAPWAECAGAVLAPPSYAVGSIMPVLFGGPNVNSIARAEGLPSYDDAIADLAGVSVPVKVVLEVFNADKTSYTSSAVDGQCYKAGPACSENHVVCRAEYCEMDVWAAIIADFKAASPGLVTVLGSVDSSTTVSAYDDLNFDGFYFVETVGATSGGPPTMSPWEMIGMKANCGLKDLAISPDASFVAYACLGQQDVKKYDVATDTWTSLSGHGTFVPMPTGWINPNWPRVYSVAVSPDSSLLVSGGVDNTARIWDAATGTELRVLTGHAGYVVQVVFSPDGSLVITRGDNTDKTVRLWDVATGALLHVLDIGEQMWTMAVSADGSFVVTGHNTGSTNKAAIFDVATGALRHVLGGEDWAHPLTAPTPLCYAIYRSCIWDATGVDTIAISPDSSFVATSYRRVNQGGVNADGEGLVRIWDSATGNVLHVLPHLPDRTCLSLAFSPNGRYLACGSSYGHPRGATVWDLEALPGGYTEDYLFTMHTPGEVIKTVAFSPDSQFLVTAGGKDTILWHVETGAYLVQMRCGGGGGGNFLAVSPDFSYLVTNQFFWANPTVPDPSLLTVSALGSPLFDETAVGDHSVFVTLAAPDLGIWNPFAWYPSVSPSKWAAIVTEATDTSAIATLFDRGYGWVYLTSEADFATRSSLTGEVLAAIEAVASGRRLESRRLQASEPYWGCDDTLLECAPICLKQTGAVTTKVSTKLCGGEPLDPCACKCYHEAQWTCEGGNRVVCQAKFAAGDLRTVGDKVCETRGAPKPASTAELKRTASTCEPVTEMRGSAPAAECLAQWRAADGAPTADPDLLSVSLLHDQSFAAPLALAVFALYA